MTVTMKIKHLTWSFSAVVAAIALAACGGGGGGSDNGVASKSPTGIVNAATHAIQGVQSVHISGSLIASGTPITLNLHLVAGKGATGEMSTHGLSFKLVSVGGEVYINGSNTFWHSFGNPAVAQLLAGKWLKTTATGNFASIGRLTDVKTLFAQVFSYNGPLAKGQTSTVNGQQVVAVRDTTKGGTLFVATTGKPYPVELRKVGSDAGQVTFDEYNQPVSLTAPSNAIDASKFGL
jgi:hypothetical protein